MSAEEYHAAALKLYLLDIEGTVAPITLTTELLFPYARRHFAEFLAKNSADAAVRSDLDLLAEENHAETGAEVPHIPTDCHPERRSSAPADDRTEGSAVVGELLDDQLRYIFWLMDRDRKSTALKSLQGKIWKAGFESGELKGTLFDDVPAALERWSKQGKVAIYSSGSADAQKILFRHTVFGDLTPMISGYFDTRTGAKTASASYAAIAAAMSIAPHEMLFFSDVVRELDAAREAGCGTRLVVREGNAPVDDARGHAMIRSFDEAAHDDPVHQRKEAGRL